MATERTSVGVSGSPSTTKATRPSNPVKVVILESPESSTHAPDSPLRVLPPPPLPNIPSGSSPSFMIRSKVGPFAMLDHVFTSTPHSNSLWHVNMQGHHVQCFRANQFLIPFDVELLNNVGPVGSIDSTVLMMARCMASCITERVSWLRLSSPLPRSKSSKTEFEEALFSTKNKMEDLEVENDLLQMEMATVSALEKEAKENLGCLQGELEQSQGLRNPLRLRMSIW